MIKISKRLKKLPPYLFIELDKQREKAKKEGRDIIDLGIGDPDEPPPKEVVESLCQAALDPKNHRYAHDQGLLDFRERIAEWYKKRFNVHLNPENEVLPLIGSKEGLSHIPLAFVNPKDFVLVPDPCYPPYKGGTILAEGVFYSMPLLKENAFLPDLNKISLNILKKSKLLFINYPNNPTGATCEKGFFRDVVLFATRHNLIVCHDAAYSEISFDGYRAGSFLNVEGAKAVGVEFHSLSKTCNMSGFRVGFVVGNSRIIEALGKVKTNIDSGIFTAIQLAGVTALSLAESHLIRMNNIYQRRRDILVEGLNDLGWPVEKPKATFYVWATLPKGYKSSMNFCKFLLGEADIIATPGVGFGQYSEGYIRMALCISEERIEEAVVRLKKIL